MADCTRETVMVALKALLDTALAAAYTTNYTITRNPAKDPKTMGAIGLYILEGGAGPSDDNAQAFETVPVLLSLRVAVAVSEGEYIQPRLNNAEAIVLTALRTVNLTAASRTVAMFISNISRELGLNESWSDITLTLTFPA
jgi:hypothetical protein